MATKDGQARRKNQADGIWPIPALSDTLHELGAAGVGLKIWGVLFMSTNIDCSCRAPVIAPAAGDGSRRCMTCGSVLSAAALAASLLSQAALVNRAESYDMGLFDDVDLDLPDAVDSVRPD